MPTEVRSVTQKLADRMLNQPVERFIAERRQKGRSWRFIARDLYEATGGEVDVTERTLQMWAAAATAAAGAPAKAVGE